MSISILEQVATQALPVDISDREQMAHLRTLDQAGLIAAFYLRSFGGTGRSVIRVLAVTSDGRRLLQRCAQSNGSEHEQKKQ